MKKILLLLALTVGLGNLSNAQTENTDPKINYSKMDHSKMIDKKVEIMTTKLSLSKDQQDKLKSILEDNLNKAKELRDDKRSKINEILTPEQAEKFFKLKEEIKRNPKNFRKLHYGPKEVSFNKKQFNDNFNSDRRIEYLSKELSLKKKQKKQIKEIFDNNKDSFKGLSMNQIKELRANQDKQIKSVLTSKQIKKYDELKENRRKEFLAKTKKCKSVKMMNRGSHSHHRNFNKA